MKNIFAVLILSALFFFNVSAQNQNGVNPIRICNAPKVNASYENAFQGMMQKYQQFANGKKTSVVYNIPVYISYYS